MQVAVVVVVDARGDRCVQETEVIATLVHLLRSPKKEAISLTLMASDFGYLTTASLVRR